MTELSVIMGIYQERFPKAVERAVSSILGQSVQNLELILYADGSGKELCHQLRELAGKDSRILLLTEKRNHGLAYGLNRCLERAKGPFIARMDADDYALPQRLEKQLCFLAAHRELSWAGTGAYVYDTQGIWGRMERPFLPDKADYLRYSPFIHSSVVFRREALEKAGGYKEDGRLTRFEDYELFLRMYSMGLWGGNMPGRLQLYYADRHRYHRRRMSERIREAYVRAFIYREMGSISSRERLYAFRPICGGLIPPELVREVKLKCGRL